MISRVINYNTEVCIFQQQKITGIKRKKMAYSKEKYILIWTIPGEAQTFNLLDKDFKTTFLNMLREIKKNMKKGSKMIYEQN